MPELHFHTNPSENDIAQVIEGLQAFNRETVGHRDLKPLQIVLKDEAGRVCGGVLGETIWQWLLVSYLWVHPDYRGASYGKRLLLAAEQAALERGCGFVALETFSFQAPRLYYQLGYRAYGQVDQFPPGHTRFSLWKPLQPHSTDVALDRQSQEISQPAPGTQSDIDQSFFALLYQTSLDMLARHDLSSLLQTIVEHAANILDAPYSELMLVEGDELVVRAFTGNQSYLIGDKVKRGEALVSWRAHDTGLPAIIDNYSQWAGRRVVYGDAELQAVGDFPIMAGNRCLGVLGLGRVKPGHRFDALDIERGLRFSRLAALVIDHAQAQETAQKEIASRRKAEQELMRINRQLAEQNSELDAYAHSVAHDLKNPLTTILGMIRIARAKAHDLPEAQLQVMLAMADRNAAKMQEIIDALLLMGSLRKESDLVLQEVDMGQIIREVLQRLDAQILESGAVIDIAPYYHSVRGMRSWLEQVMMNYVSNAIKYGGEPPQIAIRSNLDAQDLVTFTVCDNGLGVSEDDIPGLFGAFERFGDQQKEGHGVGLSLVKRIVEKLGGKVAYERRELGGSCFSFQLPVGKADNEEG